MAVRAKYGPQYEERMRLWPDLAKAYATAWYGNENAEAIEDVVQQARLGLNRCKRDVTYALECAAAISRAEYLLPEPMTMVPTPQQIRGWEKRQTPKPPKMEPLKR